MKKIENLKDLFIEQSRELYDSNRQELKELPSIEKQATSTELKKIIKKQVGKVKSQQECLMDALAIFDAEPDGEKCETTEAILRHSHTLINASNDNEVRDASILNAVQQLGHRKIAGLGSTSAYARELGRESTAKSLHVLLNDEHQIDRELTLLAQDQINKQAVAPRGRGV